MGSGSATAGARANRAKFWLAAVGVLLGGLLLTAAGVQMGPYGALTAQTGKLHVDYCIRTSKSTSRHSWSSRGVSHKCYGTFRSDDGSYTDHDAYVVDKAGTFRPYTTHSKGDAFEIHRLNGGYSMNVANDFGFGAGLAFLGVLVFLAGLFATVTHEHFGWGQDWDLKGAKRKAPRLYRVCLWAGGICGIGILLSLAVCLIVPS